jgi:hypothetical protein
MRAGACAANPEEGSSMNRRNGVRLTLLVLVGVLSIFLYRMGKGFDLLLDNKTVTIGEKTYKAFSLVRVSVDGSEPLELMKRDREVISVVGYNHRIKVEVLDMDEDVVKTVEKEFEITRETGDLLSIPALVEGEPDWIIVRPKS